MVSDTTAVIPARPAGLAGRRFGLLLQASAWMFIRNRASMFWVIAFPIALMLLFGAVYGSHKEFIPYLASGMIVVSLMANGIIGNAGRLAEWREQGILRRVQATPLPVWQLLLSRILVQGAIMVLQAFLLLGTSAAIFGAQYDGLSVLRTVPVVALGALLFMAFGQTIAALVPKVETVTIIGQVVYFPLMFLGNLMIPLSTMPDYLQTAGQFLPSALLVDLLRMALLGSTTGSPGSPVLHPLPTDLLGLACYFAASLFLATRFFKWS